MVVMAIIAILATAGLAVYMWYIRKARDTARISDIATINKALLAVVTQTGQSPKTIPEVILAIKAVNSGTSLKDPQSGNNSCQPSSGTTLVTCDYVYTQCDDGSGFAVGTRFEASTNVGKYGYDNIDTVPANSMITTASNLDNYYELGSCTAYCTSATSCGNPDSVSTYTAIK